MIKTDCNTISKMEAKLKSEQIPENSFHETQELSELNLPRKVPTNKNMINLENILLLENKLSSLMVNLKNSDAICKLWEEWWELSQEETMLQNLGNVFKEPKFKLILKMSTILEVVSITLWHWMGLQNDAANEIIILGM